MRRHSRATATGSGKMMIDLRHEHEIDTAGTWWSAMGQNQRCRQRLSTAGLPSTAEELLPCQAVRSDRAPEPETGGCEAAPNRDHIQHRSMPRMLLGNTGTAAEHDATRAAVP